jgi:hypothetical protein
MDQITVTTQRNVITYKISRKNSGDDFLMKCK